jgi:hypothetical protein
MLATELSFGPGATLIFPEESSLRKDPECGRIYYIVADRITTEPEGATITWERSPITDRPFDRGRAPAGASGAAPGEPGMNGTAGAPGNPGYGAQHGPALVLITKRIEGKLTLDFRGQDGGSGGVGQSGGDGGSGLGGRPAVSSFFDCRRGPGPGGNGGNGGEGGRGGRGGDGGFGGTVVVITTREGARGAAEFLDVNVEPGKGGKGGPGGDGGRPGKGGPEGSTASPFCRRDAAGRDGDPGNPGTEGPQGETGLDGEDGISLLIELQDRDFKKVISPVSKK